MSDNNSRLVYSTETGRVEAKNIKTQRRWYCRIRRETKGREQGVSVVDGLLLEHSKSLCVLEENMGTGGAVKGHTIEIKGAIGINQKLT